MRGATAATAGSARWAQQAVEPARLRHHLGVDEGDDRAVGRPPPRLPRRAGPAGALVAEDPRTGRRARDRDGRAVVDHHHLAHRAEGGERRRQLGGGAPDGDHHGDVVAPVNGAATAVEAGVGHPGVEQAADEAGAAAGGRHGVAGGQPVDQRRAGLGHPQQPERRSAHQHPPAVDPPHARVERDPQPVGQRRGSVTGRSCRRRRGGGRR